MALALALSCGGRIKKNAPVGNASPDNAMENGRTGSNGRTTGPNAATNGRTIPGNNSNNRDWSTCYQDGDEDGFGDVEQMIDAPCSGVPGLAWEGGDCDDGDDSIYPDAPEMCDGVERNCDGAWTPDVPAVCSTIQQAIDVSADVGFEGQIHVAPGTYMENIVFGGAAVQLIGAGPETTTIDGSMGDDAVVTFSDGEDSDSVLQGFTITGGSGHTDGERRQGGGIWIDEADPTLRNLIVTDNQALGDSGYGGGISMSRSAALIERVDIVANRSTYYGGGVHISQSEATLRQVRLIANQSLYGGGLAVYYSNDELLSLVVAGNVGVFGGGVMFQGESPTLEFAHLVGNQGEDGGAVKLLSDASARFEHVNISENIADQGGAIDASEGTATVAFSNVYDNGAAPLVDLDLTGADGIIESDPELVSTSGDPKGWDLHLQATSPLIDAGDPGVTDADGSPADIGAFGGPHSDW
jgi:hypothetical protein